jgi:hypothetical protein
MTQALCAHMNNKRKIKKKLKKRNKPWGKKKKKESVNGFTLKFSLPLAS